MKLLPNPEREFVDAFKMFDEQILQTHPALALMNQALSNLLKRTRRSVGVSRYLDAIQKDSSEVADLVKLQWALQRW